jgi:hypothetical protein
VVCHALHDQFAIALRIIAHGRAAVPVSRLLHDPES